MHLGGSTRPVMLVHGLHSAEGHLSFWSEHLLKAGHSCYTFSYPSSHTVEDISGELSRAVLDVRDTTRGPLALLGHSLGGVLACYATSVLGLGEAEAVSSVTAVCSPFGGSPWSRLAGLSAAPALVRQLQAESSLLSTLRMSVEADTSLVRWTSLSAALDLVVPASNAVLPSPRATHVGIPGEDHLSVLVSTTACHVIAAALA